MEQSPQSELESKDFIVDYSPNVLKVKDLGIISESLNNRFIPKEEDLVVKLRDKDLIEGNHKFVMLKNISGLSYLFTISGIDRYSDWELAFTTLEYEFSRTSLDDKAREELFKTLADFLETIYIYKNNVDIIQINPSKASYTVEDVENCIKEITTKSKDYSEEELRKNYKGAALFNLYKKISGKGYYDEKDFKEYARSRFFKMNFKKYLKNWSIDEEDSKTNFYLDRKK